MKPSHYFSWLLTLSIFTLSSQSRNSPKRLFFSFPTLESDETSSSSESDEPLVARQSTNLTFVAAAKNNNIHYLILDKACYSLSGRSSMVTNTIILEGPDSGDQRIAPSKQCWMEIPQSGVLPGPVWDAKGDVKILIHGYSSRIQESAETIIRGQNIFRMGEEYSQDTKPHNIITIDWTDLSASPVYGAASFATRNTGLQIALFLKKLIDNVQSLWKNVHVIGFSLGAHVAGIAGYQLQRLYGVKLGRITGLDPAGPNFDLPYGIIPIDLTGFLEKSDAEFVDVIHCNMGIHVGPVISLITGRFGSVVQSGHADFYPNGGETQPTCSAAADTMGCSHSTCPRYFIDSIRKTQYQACGCVSWIVYLVLPWTCLRCRNNGVLMGEPCSTSANGRYYIRATPPP